MASGLTRFGNDLYTGERSVPFIRMRAVWLSIAAVLMLIALAVPFVRGGGDFGAGFNFGIEFSGEFDTLNWFLSAQNGTDGQGDERTTGDQGARS